MDLRQGSPFLALWGGGGGGGGDLPTSLHSVYSLTGLQGSLFHDFKAFFSKVCSPFVHDEFKLAHRCVCITSNISTMNSFERVKKEND